MRRPVTSCAVLLTAGCAIGPGPRVRTGIGLAAPVELRSLAAGVRSFHADVVVWNPARERLTLLYGCGVPVQLQYEARGRWYPALRLAPIACVASGVERTLAEGDSLRFPLRYDDVRSGATLDAAGVRWLGPLPGRYRFIVSTEGERRRGQRWRGGREVRLESRPFEIGVAESPPATDFRAPLVGRAVP